jgi:hydroxymethylbilane synthase
VKFPLATRASRLAMWQAETTQTILRAKFDDLDVDLLPVESSGDQRLDIELAKFGRIGIFTVEVDRILLAKRASASVHSLKDMITDLEPGIVLAGTLQRGPTEDVIISTNGERLEDLAPGASVATGSRRRAAMLLAVRPDLKVVGIRGNVETRLRKLDEGEADALIMARAGIERLELGARITEVIDTERFLPAVGQGIVGIVCREEDTESQARIRAITCMDSWHSALAERSLLSALRGGCNVPVGGHAQVSGDDLTLRARVLSLDGVTKVEGTRTGPREDAVKIGSELAQELIDQGAAKLIEAARE